MIGRNRRPDLIRRRTSRRLILSGRPSVTSRTSPSARFASFVGRRVLAEDTRHTRRLLERYGIDTRLVSYHAHNEMKRGFVTERMRSGASLALVSDAGTPAVADPGRISRRHAPRRGFGWCPCRGCAPAAAMGASGLPSESFTFVGFLPPKSGKRRKRLERSAGAPGSVVAVPPHKLVATLEDAAAVFGGEGGGGVPRDDQGATAARVFFPALSLALIFSSPEARGARRARARVRSRQSARVRSRACVRVIALCRFWRVTRLSP